MDNIGVDKLEYVVVVVPNVADEPPYLWSYHSDPIRAIEQADKANLLLGDDTLVAKTIDWRMFGSKTTDGEV